MIIKEMKRGNVIVIKEVFSYINVYIGMLHLHQANPLDGVVLIFFLKYIIFSHHHEAVHDV